MKHIRTILKNCIIAGFWLCIWAVLATFVAKPLLLPGPWAVLKRLWILAGDLSFWLITGKTLLRILCGLLAAIPAGILLAALTCRFRFLRELLTPLLTIVQSTPVASFILLLLVWLSRDILPSVIVFLMVTPLVWQNITAGVENVDGELLEMAQVYKLSPGRILRHIYIPSVMPYFLAACRTALGLAWKSGVAAEVLTVPKNSIGQMLYESKLYLETLDLFAWTVTVILCSLLIEKLLATAIKRCELRGGAK